MKPYLESLDQMYEAWNTADGAAREVLVRDSLEHNVHFVDPNYNILGRDAFLAMVKATQEKFPGARYERASEVDMQNNFCRFHWTISLDGKIAMRGFDVVEVNDHGKIAKVIGFFGELNPFEAEG